MSVTSGFFNSVNHDRRYDARQFSKLFDGVINDGVFGNIGDCLAVSENSGNIINVAPGKCWFNSVFVENDAILPLTAEQSEILLDRYDAVVVEIDDSITVRKGDIKVIKGTPASTPQYPAMASTETLHQYPLAYIHRKAGSIEIKQADITNMVGMGECPYITGILEVHNIDHIVAQWEAQWKDWMSQWAGWELNWEQWFDNETTTADDEMTQFMVAMKSEFDRWFNELQVVLEPDVATNLATRVIELQEKFRDLARDRCVYEDLEDSDLDVLLDSNGGVIEGKTVMGSSQSGSPSGGMSYNGGDLNMSGNKITGLGAPSVPADAATKGYVDDKLVKTEITFYASKWVENTDTSVFSQTVEVEGGTVNSIISLQPTIMQTLSMLEEEVALLQVDNEDGIFIARTIGGAPSFNITIQAIISEVKV